MTNFGLSITISLYYNLSVPRHLLASPWHIQLVISANSVFYLTASDGYRVQSSNTEAESTVYPNTKGTLFHAIPIIIDLSKVPCTCS
jgi:hypothetical protein